MVCLRYRKGLTRGSNYRVKLPSLVVTFGLKAFTATYTTLFVQSQWYSMGRIWAIDIVSNSHWQRGKG